MGRLFNEPVLIGAAIRAVIYAAMAFGFKMTTEQLGALMAAVEAVLALVTRAYVTPNHLAESRVAEGLPPTVSRNNMVAFILVGLSAAMLFSACAKGAPKLSPEAKVAYYGEKFLAGVELAQDQTIGLVGTNVAGHVITKPDVTPAVEVYVQIGKAGQQLAAGLKVIDESGPDVAKVAAAKSVDEAIRSIQGLSESLTVRVQSEPVRAAIDRIVKAVAIGAKLLDVYRVIAPFLPPGATPPTVWLTPAAAGA